MKSATATTSPDPSKKVCEALNQTLAETAIPTMLAQNFHWNVTGMAFTQIHNLFEEIYEDHFEAQDGYADGNFALILAPSDIEEEGSEATAEEMLTKMLRAEKSLASTRKSCGERAASTGDTLTENFCIARGQIHEKFAWMLNAHLT